MKKPDEQPTQLRSKVEEAMRLCALKEACEAEVERIQAQHSESIKCGRYNIRNDAARVGEIGFLARHFNNLALTKSECEQALKEILK